MNENQIRLKNLIHSAAEKLRAEHGAPGRKLADRLRKELGAYMENLAFWESQTEGLLLCAEPGAITTFHLPIDTEEYVAVDSCYHLAPVLALLGDEQSFYVLAIAQHHPKLFSGSMYGLCQMEVDLPKNLEAALRIDTTDKEHTQSAGDSAHDPKQDERLRFFRIIDDIVWSAIEREIPVILAGTDNEIAEYRQISKLPNILPQAISGSFGGAKPHDLFEPAAAIIRNGLVAGRHNEAIETYKRLEGTHKDRVTDDPITIAEAARQGRIDTLLVTLRQNTADTVHDTAKAMERITFPRAELSTLINKTANVVANASGKIINLEIGALAGNRPVLALLRY